MRCDVLKRSMALWVQDAVGGPVAVAAFIAAQRARYGIGYAVACRALGVSQAWFYKWRHGDVSLRLARRRAVDAAVAYAFARRQGRDGSPPITVRLRDAGGRIS